MEDAVYNSIAIGENSSGGARINNGDKVNLRATQFVELLPGFEVELGGEFFADTHDCGI